MKQFALFFLLLPFTLRADQIPPSYLNTVVAIGRTGKAPITQQPQWITEASGFFYGYLVQNDPDPLKRKYSVFLVTNRHVVANHTQIEIRLNPTKPTDQGRSLPVPLTDANGLPISLMHPDPNVDIAIIPINSKYLENQGLQSVFLESDVNAENLAKLKASGLSAGDGVFILGFPMGIAGKERNYVITRKGSIARISDYLAGVEETFLIDALIFPGNSGGPVFSAANLSSIIGTPMQSSVLLIGVVRAYIPYDDVAVSQQTQQPRVIFEENSGLADVVPVERVDETIRVFLQLHPPDVGNSLPPGKH